MLDAGTSLDMLSIIEELSDIEINYAVFYEPDLNNIPTSVCFLADERVWNKQEYQSKIEFYESQDSLSLESWVDYIGGKKNIKLIQILEGKRLSM